MALEALSMAKAMCKGAHSCNIAIFICWLVMWCSRITWEFIWVLSCTEQLHRVISEASGIMVYASLTNCKMRL